MKRIRKNRQRCPHIYHATLILTTLLYTLLGYGLSYTKFVLSSLKVQSELFKEGETVSFTVDILNQG